MHWCLCSNSPIRYGILVAKFALFLCGYKIKTRATLRTRIIRNSFCLRKYFRIKKLPNSHIGKGSLILLYLKERNLRGKKISRISRNLAKFAKINSFFDPEKCWFAKINSREISQTWWFAKIHSREILQELMNCEYWSFCRLSCHLFT